MKVVKDYSGGNERPAAGPLDVLDADGVMREILHISDKRTLSRLIADGLPCHWPTAKHRVFIRGEVLDWLTSRCINTVPDQQRSRRRSAAS